MVSKARIAVDWMQKYPSITMLQAAKHVGIAKQTVHEELQRRQKRQLCPLCAQVIRKGFSLSSNPAADERARLAGIIDRQALAERDKDYRAQLQLFAQWLRDMA